MIRELISALLLIIGTFFMVVAAVGVVRMPDLFTRMSATTKAATLGASFTLLGVAVHFDSLPVTAESLAIIIFLLLTAPVAAHMIGRAAYFDGVPLWQGTLYDELRGRYNEKTHRLSGSAGATSSPESPEESR